MSGKYVVISPCRDEAEHLPACIASVAAQTVLPARWVIVDDGSTDESPRILEEAAREQPFITVVRRDDRGRRSVGPGVIEAFYQGLDTVDTDGVEYVCKLDCDLELPPRYFERLMEIMGAEPRVGNLSGKLYLRTPGGGLAEEIYGDENAIGAMKFYSVRCFDDIGGFVRQVGWDGIDGHLCRMKGWIAQSVHDDDLRVIHRRPLGSSDRSVLTGRVRGGRGKWHVGSSLGFVLASALYRALERPALIGSALTVWGYLLAAARREPRYIDRDYLRALRRFEWDALRYGKRGALVRRNALLSRLPERAGAPAQAVAHA